jgi:hypothetical protein
MFHAKYNPTTHFLSVTTTDANTTTIWTFDDVNLEEEPDYTNTLDVHIAGKCYFPYDINLYITDPNADMSNKEGQEILFAVYANVILDKGTDQESYETNYNTIYPSTLTILN